MTDLLPSAEEGVADIRVWTVHSDTNALAMSKDLVCTAPIIALI